MGDWGWQAGWKVKALAPGSQLTKGFVKPAAGWTLITVGGAQARGRAIQCGRAGGRRETLIRHNVCSWQVDTIPPEDLKGRLGPQGPRPLELGFTKCARAAALCRALCLGAVDAVRR